MEAIEKRARELLAKKYAAGGCNSDSDRIRDGDLDRLERQAVAAIISALTPPEGYVLVPVDPTEGMLKAFKSIPFTGLTDRERYQRMLADRPEVKP